MYDDLKKHKNEFEDYYVSKGQTLSWADWNRDKLGGNDASHKYQKLKEIRKNMMILDLIPPKSRVIVDAGAGFGTLTIQINKHIPGVILLCTDISEVMLKYLKENFRIHGIKAHIVLCALEYLPVKSNYVDCLILREVLEHVQSPRNGLGEISRTLKDNGKVILTTPRDSKSYNFVRCKLFGTVFPIREVKTHYKDEIILESKLTEMAIKKKLNVVYKKYFDFELPLVTGLCFKVNNILIINILFVFYEVMEKIFSKLFKTRILMVLKRDSRD